jgi:hypothetical protein
VLHICEFDSTNLGGRRNLIGAYVSYGSWRKTREEREGSHHHLMEVGEGRTRFFAFAGMFTSLIFALVIFCDTVGILLVPACAK